MTIIMITMYVCIQSRVRVYSNINDTLNTNDINYNKLHEHDLIVYIM